MADTIKLGNLEISSFKVGSTDVDKIYLGSTLLYPSEPPTPTFKWKATYASGTSSAQCDVSSAITRYEISSTGLQAVEIGDCVTTISSNTFYEYTSMTSVTIGNNVTTIGGYAFNKCSGLTSVTIPNSVTSIGMDAFENCNGLSSVTIPNSVATINEYAFYSCKNLKNVTIGTGVTRIGNYAFRYCTGLTSITIEATTPPSLGVGAFDYTNDCYIRVPNNSVNAFKSAWSSYANRIISIDTQYIQLQGIQRKAGNLGWVDLGLTVGTDFKIEMSLQYNTAAGGRFISIDSTFRWFMATQSGTLKSFFDYNGQRISVAAGSAYPLNTDYTITLTNFTMKSSLDSTTTTGATQTSYTPSGNLGIFSTNISSNGDLGIVYSVKVYTNDGATLVGDFIPVKRISDNMITLYNTVTDTFCTATGTLAAVT